MLERAPQYWSLASPKATAFVDAWFEIIGFPSHRFQAALAAKLVDDSVRRHQTRRFLAGGSSVASSVSLTRQLKMRSILFNNRSNVRFYRQKL
jgi:hypothetical protein